jgi:hypothetical protein
MAETTKHTGRNKLVSRLAAQVGSKPLAENILKKRGHMTKSGKLTEAGKKRDAMTAGERAKDRESKRSGRPTKDYKYKVKTNTAVLKKGK